MTKLFNVLFNIGRNIWLLACLLTILIAGMDYVGLLQATKRSLEIVLLIGFGLGIIIPVFVLLVAWVVVLFKK